MTPNKMPISTALPVPSPNRASGITLVLAPQSQQEVSDEEAPVAKESVLPMKAVKQDPRVERPEARDGEDWVYLGDAKDSVFSVFTWYRRVQAFHGGPREPTPAHSTMKHMYMTYEKQMAPSVPCGIAVTGSRSDDARLAPERIPVKHGK